MSGWGQAARSAARPSVVPTSAATVLTLAPVSRTISLAAASSARSSRPFITTSQPASASAVAQAFPRPLLEAQTTALRPLMPRSMSPSPIPQLRAKQSAQSHPAAIGIRSDEKRKLLRKRHAIDAGQRLKPRVGSGGRRDGRRPCGRLRESEHEARLVFDGAADRIVEAALAHVPGDVL